MLLRRFTQHVKHQNWFAVGLDFVIVVLGVFIGLQVSNWNLQRQDRGVEARIIERLQDEVPALIGLRAPDAGFSEMRRAGLESAVSKLFSDDPGASLDDRECLAVALSHIYSLPADDLPAIEELTATGRADLIRDETIRAALSGFILARNRGRAIQSAVSIDIHQLALEFPDLISTQYIAAGDGGQARTGAFCDSSAMRASPGFLNTLISNQQRFLTYYEAEFEAVDPKLLALKTALGPGRTR